MLTKTRISDHAFLATFATPEGAHEHFLTITGDPGAGFPQSLAHVEAHYASALRAAGLSEETQIFTRVYLGDVANQAPILRQSALYKQLETGAVSAVGEACLNGGAACLFSYHVTGTGNAYPRQKITDPGAHRNSLLLSMRNYSILWNAGFCGTGQVDSCAQTQEVFGAFGGIVGDEKMSLLSNTIRTWVFVRDIDNNYADMVKARREFFAAHNLTEKTRYLASTGIEGKSEAVNSLVTIDALSIGGLRDGQISRMDALDNMPRTIDYGVTFERGLRVRFGDRSHLYVSGTASIDKGGKVLHPGNVRAQTERTIENVTALLGTEGGTLGDLAYLFVYVRNFHDYDAVRETLASRIAGDLPVLYLHGAVCRPAWLVEMEGVAIASDSTGFLPFV